MTYKLYDFVDGKGINQIKKWTQGLQKRDRVRLNRKLDLLEQSGKDLPPGLLSDTDSSKIKKLRITGRKVPTLRPMLCRGPINVETEFTILQGAIEQDRKLVPSDAVLQAEQKRQIILDCPSRRCEHEQVN
ncbi:MAG: hypothetical protein F4201_07825 [Nitrospira sp. SB0677_bin_15]|nr:hypothetical protein [Nitrospira sp. SB0677_bin_15]